MVGLGAIRYEDPSTPSALQKFHWVAVSSRVAENVHTPFLEESFKPCYGLMAVMDYVEGFVNSLCVALGQACQKAVLPFCDSNRYVKRKSLLRRLAAVRYVRCV